MAIYTAHLDYLDCAYYNVRGYDGSTWKEIARPRTVEEVLKVNTDSQRDDAIRLFIEQARKDIAASFWVVTSTNLPIVTGWKQTKICTTIMAW